MFALINPTENKFYSQKCFFFTEVQLILELFLSLFKKLNVNLVNKAILERLKKKNIGNIKLEKAIDKLILDIEQNDWDSPNTLRQIRPDADCVHSEGFYFFDLNIHRTMVLIEFDENKRARIIWAGSHQDYDKIFRNNRSTIRKWLKNNEWI